MESGEFKKRNLPYGYRWDEEHSNMVFDEETAPTVSYTHLDVYKRQT